MSVESAVAEYVKNNTPADMKKKISDLNLNLYNGPGCGTWDDSTIEEVKDFVDQFPTLYYCDWAGMVETTMPDDNTEEAEDYIKVSSDMVCSAILGKELAKTIYM